ncbi:Uncharacterized protein TCM_036105 [Theobroma cacao]|uniref:Uncharacterized protein n=1 Tax=Theobroma cacao TaxID=3641 RepID=A0A061FIT5_THECC|nr:Uncharacterized protein TCM_036105 [Theobroma cacao]
MRREAREDTRKKGQMATLETTSTKTITATIAVVMTMSIPSLLPTIQDRLLDSRSLLTAMGGLPVDQPIRGAQGDIKLMQEPWEVSLTFRARPAATLVRGTAANIPQPVSELNGSALVQLALQTLARHELLEFARESVVVYLDDEHGAT